ncbi:hypothetical protein [Massilia aquatica]|uniref:Uncharacterized protein n=1 Tax=Massilia aquatica TaxID=2609000 RepID=A0ABX0M2N2_9BURK|nr:hypothetical protein [Massilia aquatica]NHZ38582.1 hypothetical protein [Massilia aquatica]
MGLKDFLNGGRMVKGSSFDTKLKPLGSMSETTQRRLGYADASGNWTDRGYDRATSRDYQGLEKSRHAMLKAKK